VAVSVDYWLYTDEPIDTELTHDEDDIDADVVDAETPSSIVTMVATHSGLWRFCIDAKADYIGEFCSPIQQNAAHFCPVADRLKGVRTGLKV